MNKKIFSVTFLGFFSWFLTSLFYSFQFFLRSAPNAMADQLMSDLHIQVGLLGVLSSAYYIPYVLLQIPLGVSLDIWGPKRILRWGCGICVLGSLVFSWADTFHMALLGRFLIGVGAAGSFIGSIRLNGLWFSTTYLGFAVGLLSAFGKIGGSAANALLPGLVQNSNSWTLPFQWIGVIGVILCALIWIFIKNGPKDQFIPEITQPSFLEIKKSFIRVAREPVVWTMGLYVYALYLTLTVFSDTYSINFFSKHLDITREKAGILASLVGIGSAVGSCVITFVSDRFQQRRFFARLSAIGVFALSFLVFFAPPLPLQGVAVILFFFGFFSGGQVLSYIVATETLSYRNAGMVSGIINTLAMAGGIFHNLIIGWIMQRFWDGQMQAGHPVYSISTYRIGFSTLSLYFALAVIMTFCIKESHPKRR